MLRVSSRSVIRVGVALAVTLAVLGIGATPALADDCDGHDQYTNDCDAGSADRYATSADLGSSGATVDVSDEYDAVATAVVDTIEAGADALTDNTLIDENAENGVTTTMTVADWTGPDACQCYEQET